MHPFLDREAKRKKREKKVMLPSTQNVKNWPSIKAAAGSSVCQSVSLFIFAFAPIARVLLFVHTQAAQQTDA